jgi:hypothetical protein
MIGFRIRAARLMLFVLMAVFLGSATLAPPRVIAQVPGSVPSPGVLQPDLMPALLAEVKAIRADVREAARMGTRSQLLLGRVQLQQLHLAHLDQRLALASARRIDAAKDRAATAARLRDLDRRRADELSADERNAVEADRRQLKSHLQAQQSIEDQRRREENELSSALSAEEESLRQLTARLDALEARLAQ